MEAQGQRQLVASDQIPVKLMDRLTEAMMETMGFQLGPVCSRDPIFREATLPPGWMKLPTDHNMWSKVVDGQDRQRLAIFYNAAYYSRSAYIEATCRFNYTTFYDGRERINHMLITDSGQPIGDPVASWGDKDWETSDKANMVARNWLETNRPDYLNPMAYWDEP